MAHSRDGALHDKNIRACFLRDGAETIRALRNRAHRRRHIRVLDLFNPCRNQVLLDRFGVNFLEERGDFRFVGLDDFLQYFLRIFVAALHAFEIEDGEPAKFSHGDGELHIDHAVHRAGEDRDFEFQRLRLPAREAPGDVDFVGVNCDAARDQSDLVEAIGHACFSIPANPHSHD